ncbi:hypothetical protein [Clostridium sp.]|uniref:hypothetical protein n=1 Tax=Clostridium sp. TaxID=1506 RepID=UPI002FC60CBA
MDFTLLVVIIGVVGYLYDMFSSAAKEGDKKARQYKEQQLSSLKVDEFDIMDSPPIHIDTEVKKKKKKKSKIKEAIDKPYNKEKVAYNEKVVKTLNYTIGNGYAEDDAPPKKRVKKNPFNYTKNPIANAVIASEILSKPKCKI